MRWARQPALAGLKHLNRLEQVLAARECRERGLDELLVCDTAGRLVAATRGNLFLLRGDTLVTPDLAACGIAGTRRRLLLDTLAPALGLAAEVTALEPAALAPSPSEFSELPSSCRADLSLAAWSALRLERPAAGVASEAVPATVELIWFCLSRVCWLDRGCRGPVLPTYLFRKLCRLLL